jgi:hypothetical protein
MSSNIPPPTGPQVSIMQLYRDLGDALTGPGSTSGRDIAAALRLSSEVVSAGEPIRISVDDIPPAWQQWPLRVGETRIEHDGQHYTIEGLEPGEHVVVVLADIGDIPFRSYSVQPGPQTSGTRARQERSGR